MGNEKYELFDWDKMPDDAPEPYEFAILKKIGKDGKMLLPQHTGNTETRIDTLPGASDLQQND